MKEWSVEWAAVATRDLERIIGYLFDQNPTVALKALDQLECAALSLTALADRGRVVPELAAVDVERYRELVILPYRLVYASEGDRVVVLGVFDARRSLEDILLNRLLYF